jgi:hypothetical protein
MYHVDTFVAHELREATDHGHIESAAAYQWLGMQPAPTHFVGEPAARRYQTVYRVPAVAQPRTHVGVHGLGATGSARFDELEDAQ